MHQEQSHRWIETAKDLWCGFLHDEPMWPINGRYQCRKCLRYSNIPWAAAPQSISGYEHPYNTGSPVKSDL
jgi:hypothetical protein